MTRTKKRAIFFGCMSAVPILIFVVFYGIVNLNTLILAFKSYTALDGNQVGYRVAFAGIENFKVVFQMLAYGDNWKMVTNSLLLCFLKLVIGLSFSIIFSFYIYKKMNGSAFFRVILFLPNVISNLIMVYLFRYLADDGIKILFALESGLLQNPKTELATIIFFNLWLGFAGQTLMFTSAMSGINESVVESAEIDGANTIRELWHITLPMIFPTFTTFVVIGLAEMFTDQMSLVTFYDKFSVVPRMRTVGYYLFQQAYTSELVPTTPWTSNPVNGRLSYPQLSAFGLMISLIIIPLSFSVKKVLEKFGPSAE